MNGLRFVAMESALAAGYRAGRADANGLPPERLVSDGSGLPCRHCLTDIEAGAAALLFAWRPFDVLHAYAETGPVFLHAMACARHASDDGVLPPVVRTRPRTLVRGYDAGQRIVDGSGGVVESDRLLAHCERLLDDARIDTVHLRSASNGCYTCRVRRRMA